MLVTLRILVLLGLLTALVYDKTALVELGGALLTVVVYVITVLGRALLTALVYVMTSLVALVTLGGALLSASVYVITTLKPALGVREQCAC